MLRCTFVAELKDQYAYEELSGFILGNLLIFKIPEKLCREITEARAEKGDLPYDELISLPYLKAIVEEAFRLYPPVSFLTRTTRQDIIMPLSKPLTGLNGEEIHEILVPNNTNLFISITEANRNPDIWSPGALEWIPERWLSPRSSLNCLRRVCPRHLLALDDLSWRGAGLHLRLGLFFYTVA